MRTSKAWRWFVLGAALPVAFASIAAESDADVTKLIVGTWRAASKNEGANAGRIAVTYFADGKFKLVLYADDACQTLKFQAGGTWLIRDGELLTKTESATGSEERLRPGSVTKDRIVAIDGNKMSLVNSAGRLLQRSRGAACSS